MNFSVIRMLVFMFLPLLFPGIYAKGPSTCRDLQYEITSREDEIERLKLTLEEYRLARDDKEDESDECNGYDTCSKCLLQREYPSCGWCVLHNRCSQQENCHGSSDSNSNLWTTSTDRCPKIRAVKPPYMAIQRAKMLQISVLLPEYHGMFICSFEILGKTVLKKGWKMNATEDGIICASPRTDEIPHIPGDDVHLPVKLSVRIPYGTNFASTTNHFSIYDCGRYTSCSECAASDFPCAWCVSGDRCTHDVDENCRNDVIVFSKAVSRPTIREGPAYCPRIVPHSIPGSNEIFFPSGSKRRIHVKIENLVSFQVQTRFTCLFGSRPRFTRQVTGQLLADTIYCDTVQINVLDNTPITRLPFSVLWDSSKKIDNVQNMHVVVYHCGLLASSCSECLDLPEKFDCGWCEESNSCTVLENCEQSGWMDRKKKCTKPKIISFYPKSGLSTRKTNITFNGINFGKEAKDIERIRLLDKKQTVLAECRPVECLFKNNIIYEIVCQLDVPENKEITHGVFEVKITDRFVAISDEEYSFADPSLTRFEPVKGIKSGGTVLKIEGESLDAGNKVGVFIGDLPCRIVSRDSTAIRCITSPSPRTRSSAVRVIFDGEEKKLSAYFFYVEDPYIRSVRSDIHGSNAPIGTLNGGNLIIAEGEYFDHVSNPYIYIIVDGVEYPGNCMAVSDKRLECLTPKLPSDVLSFCGEEGFREFDYGFRMGDALDVQNISLNENFKKFHIYPDPFYMPFTEEGKTKIYESDYLTINGRFLDTVFDETAVEVLIGSEKCVLMSLSRTQLLCRPPATQPKVEDGDENKLPEVVVRVQEKQVFFIGFLHYSDK